MTTEQNSANNKFVSGQHYNFDPPVLTNCITVFAFGSRWEEKPFAEGTCLRYEPSRNAFAFQGKPVGEEREYYFFVEWGKGSVAKNIPPPQLRVVK